MKGLPPGRKRLVFSLLLALVCLAAWPGSARALEINYPRFPGAEAPQDFLPKIESGQYAPEQALPLFVKYLYVFALVIATALATLSLLLGGLLYLLAGQNFGRLFDAKEQIIAGFLGLGLLLSSYLFLNFLNPQLTVFHLPSLGPATLPGFVPPASELLPNQTYWELPLGTLQENVLARVKDVEAPAQAVKGKTAALKDSVRKDPLCIFCAAGLADRLNNNCRCSNIFAQCETNSCSPLQCTADQAGTIAAQKTNLCRDYGQITAKKNEVLSQIDDLKAERRVLLEKKIALVKETSRLWATNQLLQSCASGGPLDRNTFLQELKDRSRVETQKVWSDVDPGKNPLIFYCPLDQTLVNSIRDDWENLAAELDTELTIDPGILPDPVGNPVCPNNKCEAGENYLNCPQDCSAPPAGIEIFPFSAPLRTPVKTQGFGDHPDWYRENWQYDWVTSQTNLKRGHNGLDLVDYSDRNVYAAAAGEVLAKGDMADCRQKVLNGQTVGYDYGVWVAVKHQALFQGQTKEFVTLYAHLEKGATDGLSVGQSVSRGQKIAILDNTGLTTGPHLHFGIFVTFSLGKTPVCDDGQQYDYPRGTAADPEFIL